MGSSLERLFCFAAVVERASFTAAAGALRCSKAHVSRQVAELERELGVQLLLRSTRRLAATAAGQRLADAARRLRAGFDAAQAELRAERSEVRGLLRLTAATTFGEIFLVDLIAEFRAAHPEVEFELDLATVRRDLHDGSWDFGFRTVRSLDERLVARAVGVVREYAVASPTLVAALGRPRQPGELERWPALRNSHFRDDSEWVFVRAAHSATVRIRAPVAMNHFPGILRAAERGIGVARLPLFLVVDALAAGRLLRLLPDWEIAPTPIYLVHAQRRHPTRLQQVFRDFAIDWLAAPPRQALLG